MLIPSSQQAQRLIELRPQYIQRNSSRLLLVFKTPNTARQSKAFRVSRAWANQIILIRLPHLGILWGNTAHCRNFILHAIEGKQGLRLLQIKLDADHMTSGRIIHIRHRIQHFSLGIKLA
ncbi:hypothetical protein D1872_122470 [compost metagenome]